jgi:transcription antitermination factor NusG
MLLLDRWYALYARARCEQIIARFLAEKGYESFVPMHKTRRRWAHGIKVMELPLFPSYVFFRMTKPEVPLVVTTPGVIRIVGAGKEPLPIEDSEIAALQTIIASGGNPQPWPFLEVGRTVQIENGPLCGLRGVVCRIRNVDRLIVSVALLKRSVAVEIDSAVVRAVPRESFVAAAGVSGISNRSPLCSSYFHSPS